MAESVVGYRSRLPEVPGREPWKRPDRHLVKDAEAPNGWRAADGRRPSDQLLVPGLRREVDSWRSEGYPGASPVALRLFEYWFEEHHEAPGFDLPFRYHFGQREAIETLVWLVEVGGVDDPAALMKKFGATARSGALPFEPSFRQPVAGARQIRLPSGDWQDLPPEGLRRYAFKMATGAGKTWVMAMAVVWSHLRKRREPESGLSTNFLVVAPNVIVYERLREDFGENRIFRRLPLIPPEWRSDFDQQVVLRGEETEPRAAGNFVLTNIQQLYERRTKPWNAENPVEAVLGPTPAPDLSSGSPRSLLERLRGLDDLVVMNDEAHHVHDDDLAWNRSLLGVHEALPGGLSLWLDFSATPRDRGGAYFPWIVCDYPLAQAVEDRIVKAPVIVSLEGQPESREAAEEETAGRSAVDRYGFWIREAVERWRAHSAAFGDLGIRPILFITTENVREAKAVHRHLVENAEFGLEPSAVLRIHTDRSGQVRPADLERARRLAREVDRPDSGVGIIVSVLMLREGWDVRNVSVVLGLRPFTATSEILPEQVVGRGLRLMRGVGPERTQTLEVMGTRRLLDMLRARLEAAGVGVGTEPVGPPDPAVVLPLEERRDRDIAFPRFGPSLGREPDSLTDLEVSALDPIFDREELEEPVRLRLRLDFAVTDTTVEEIEIADARPSRETLSQTARRVGELAGLAESGRFGVLYSVVHRYVAGVCFGREVDPDDGKVRGALSRASIREAIARYLARQVGGFITVEKETEFRDGERRLSETRPFHWRRNLPLMEAQKTVFNLVATYNDFERQFAKFLDAAEDVRRFSALAATEQGAAGVLFRVDYLKASGAIGFYYPDWIAVQGTEDGEVRWILETKGREWDGTDRKDRAMRRWCERAQEATGTRWRYWRVDQRDFEKFHRTQRTLGGLLVEILLASMEELRQGGAPMSPDEVRRARDEGRA